MILRTNHNGANSLSLAIARSLVEAIGGQIGKSLPSE
jgi:hypothetical protein